MLIERTTLTRAAANAARGGLRREVIEYYTETRTPAELEARARGWAAEVAYNCQEVKYRLARKIATREGVPYRRVMGWIRWAEREGK